MRPVVPVVSVSKFIIYGLVDVRTKTVRYIGKSSVGPKMKLQINTLYCADNLEVMRQMPGESIDLIYIDPPFATQSVRREKAWDKEVQSGEFDDRWGGGIQSYILWMKLRLTEMHRLLKPTGCLFVHLDYRAIHYIKIELDRIFGYGDGFR
jgi:DNA modification methylase